MSDGVYARIPYMNICALMFCVFVCAILMMPSSSSLYWAVSTVLVTVTHTGPPPNLAEIGHFSVSGQTIHVGTR